MITRDRAIEAAAKALHDQRCGTYMEARRCADADAPNCSAYDTGDAWTYLLEPILATLDDDELLRRDGSVVRAEKRVAFEGGDMSVLYALRDVEEVA